MSGRPPITFHVLDTSHGVPASGMRVEIEYNTSTDEKNLDFLPLGNTVTNEDGRGTGLLPEDMKVINPGIYRMIFHTMEYFDRFSTPSFYPKVEVVFKIVDPSQHYHIPLLLSPYGYSTYRGS